MLCLCAPAFAQMANGGPPEKDMESVHRLYIAPAPSDDPQNSTFRALLKQELVHSGFSVQEKAEGADATLNVEIASGTEGKQAKLEFHAMLDAGPDSNVSWHKSKTLQGSDIDRLLENAARTIAGDLRSYRFDVVTKKRDEKDKKK
jgi:hypothetical protein